MPGLFSSVSFRRPKKNKFDLSHEKKLTLDMGPLVPIMCMETVPGDSFRVRSEIMLRFAPMLAPIMHRVNVYTHYFFVPNRLIWDEWENFITGGREGTSEPVSPYLRQQDIAAEFQLLDYLGLPDGLNDAAVDQINISTLPFRAYQLIYDEYYRDQNLAASIGVPKTSGDDNANQSLLMTLRQRCWEKDYFTSALPWAQRGGESSFPVDSEVTYLNTSLVRTAGGAVPADGDIKSLSGNLNNATSTSSRIENIDEISASVDINTLRRSIKLQEWLEKNARGGARYVEQILSHFGVVSPDARIQRPEYLGGGKTPVVVSEVLSTFQDDAGAIPQGNMSGHGQSFGSTNGFARKFSEHGFVIGIMSVLPKTAYQQGIPRMFSRTSRFDYYWPEFAQIGEQEVKNKELYYNPAAAAGTADGTFGYQSRYAEYKFEPSTVHGEFRDTLDFWHMGRKFASAPALNESFVQSDPTSRIFAVTEGTQHLYCQLYNKVDAVRPMPYFGTPQ